jgi:two-component system cell cycle sensor histidine kinase/response regulator CckA
MNPIKSHTIAVCMFRYLALATLLLAAFNCLAATPENSGIPKSIRVVMDDNYPPYVFRDDHGQLKGITVDQWSLWEKKTGIHVEITGTDWNEAQRRMQAGEFDVIDTMFRNEKREQIYDFTKPYAVIPVPLFFHSDISGISGPGDARGFMVAAKAGGNVLDVLRKNGVTSIVEYPSYEKIIEAARDGKVKVFTVDRPPALYFLNKMGIQNSFRETAPLYNGEFHRAVLKGNTGLLEVIENGFAKIPKAEYEAIDKRWMGTSLAASPYLRYALYCIGAIAVLVFVLMAWLWILKRVVAKKTRELVASEEHHRSILQTAMNGIWLVDMQGRLKEVNKSYCQMSGYSEQELLTMSIPDLEVSESAGDTADRLRIIKERGEAQFESRHRRKDGTLYDVEVRVKYQPANGGQCVAFLQDITERKQSEKTLVEQAKLLDLTHDSIIVRTMDNVITYWNKGAANNYGWKAEEVVGKAKTHELLNTVFSAPLGEINDFLLCNNYWEGDLTHIKRDGSRVVVSSRWALQRNNDDVPMAVMEINNDITERKRMEEELNLFFDLVPDMVCIASTDGYFRKINRAWENVLGYTQEELLKTPFLDLIHPDDVHATMSEIEKQVGGKNTINFTNRYRCKDGSYRWLEWMSSPAKDTSILSAAARDITERMRAEQEKAALEQQLQHAQKLESLGVLAGGIAHDFNNILAVIIGHCSLAMADPDRAENSIPEIEKAAQRAAGLCRQMLAYAGKAQIAQSRFDLGGLVDEMVKMLKASLSKNVAIQFDNPAEMLFVLGDASQIRQVVMNLIINASEAIGESQGEIRVSLSKAVIKADQTVKDHQGKTIPPGRYACLEVADNGCGMDNETRQRIFEPFYTTKFTGRGLGMSAVLGIIMSHDGALQVFSRSGQGTTFRIYLPVQSSDFVGSESPQQVPAHWKGSGTVLLVEDEEMIMSVAKIMIEELGFTVIEASNGKEALELYQKHAADITLVLTDMGMPVMDGYALLGELKKLAPELPIIISSGFGNSVVSERVAPEEIAGLISKPYNFEQMQEILKTVVEKESNNHA